ncbi:MAG: glycosyltransferase family 2 protein [Candidatus Nanohaloarchaeota archaeon]|nr:glycosyltransferase family 2 protein [Candidatus Nanohaloarchaeota archaeon]
MLGSALLWIIIVLSSIFTLFWILVYVFLESPSKKTENSFEYKKVTIAIPAKDEGKTIYKTLASLSHLHYPKNKIEIIVIDDGSKDNTLQEIKRFMRNNPSLNIQIIKHTANKGKANSLNDALKLAKGEYFAVLDADTKVEKDSLSSLVKFFEKCKEKGIKVGAVISHIKVWNVFNFVTSLQRFEYIYAQFMRELMSRVGLLYITPGAFTLYDTAILRDLGGFDEKTLTEDFEIALRLKYNNYEIMKNNKAITYTFVPTTFTSFFKQRLRWNLGFIENTKKYFWKFLRKKDVSLFGHVFYPLTLLSLFILALYVMIKSLDFVKTTYTHFKIFIYSKSFHLFESSLRDWLLGLDYTYVIPLLILIVMSALIYKWALKEGNEKLDNFIAFAVFFMFYSLFTAFLWIYSYFYYVFSKRREWFK